MTGGQRVLQGILSLDRELEYRDSEDLASEQSGYLCAIDFG